jgi:type I restriction enzyme, S subunit
MNTLAPQNETSRYPRHWRVELFPEVIYDMTGGQPKVQQKDYQPQGLLPVIDQGQQFIGGYTNDVGMECTVPRPCILFGDHTRVFKWVEKSFALGADGVKVLTTREDLHPRFAYHFLHQAWLPTDQGYSRHFKFLKRLELPLPPLPEQRRIADILDKADAIRRKRQKAKSELNNLIVSQFLETFGDPLANPKNWATGTFDDHLTLVQYGPRFFNESYSSDGIRIVRITDLDQQGRLDYSAMPKMTVSDKDKDSFALRPGDLLLARSGATVGKTALIDEEAPECIAGAYFIRLRFTDKIRPLFAQMVLRSKTVQTIITERSRQSAQQNFNGPAIRALPLPVPPTEVQDKFILFHRKAIEAGSRLADAIDQADGLFNSLVQLAFRGEL